MSKLKFSPSEIRFATSALATNAALAPTLIKSYSTLRPEALVSTATCDFTHAILPASLNLPSRPVDAFKGHAEKTFSPFESFEMTPQSNGKGDAVQFSKETNTVVRCKMGGKVNAESEMEQKLIASGLMEWWTECVLFVQMSPDGKRIVEVQEFVHSAKAEELQQRLSGVLRNKD